MTCDYSVLFPVHCAREECVSTFSLSEVFTQAVLHLLHCHVFFQVGSLLSSHQGC